MGTAPVFDDMGSIMPACSYNDTLSIRHKSSANLMPNLDVFTCHIRQSANELELGVQEQLAGQGVIDAFM